MGWRQEGSTWLGSRRQAGSIAGKGGRRVRAKLMKKGSEAGLEVMPPAFILEVHTGSEGTQRSQTLADRKATVGTSGQTPLQHPSSQNQTRGGEEQGETSSTDLEPQGASLRAGPVHARPQQTSRGAGVGQGGLQAQQILPRHSSPAEKPKGVARVRDAATVTCPSSTQGVHRGLVIEMH